MKAMFTAARLLLGLIFFVMGLNGFFHFFQVPPPTSPEAQTFMGGLAGSGYFFPFLKSVESICGALLLTGYFVPLALVVISPVVVNIFMYHRFLSANMPIDIFLVILLILAVMPYKDIFSKLFKPKQTP